jgi:lipoprotein-anchoring transpeptidase ErfK/SrfK
VRAALAALALVAVACSGGTRPSIEGDVEALSGELAAGTTPTTSTTVPRVDLDPTPTTSTTVANDREVPEVTFAAAVPDGVAEITIYESPGGPEQRRMENPNINGAPRVFMVNAQEGGWVEVFLPVRPNGSTGWVKADDVVLQTVRHRVEVRLSDHELILYQEGDVKKVYPIGVGRIDRPTPGGVYYIQELLAPPDPGGPYGPYAYGLSAFTEVPALRNFAGGEGIIGIHGTSDRASIGTEASSGCIRLYNEDVTDIKDNGLPLGTPVDIIA